MIHRQEQQDEAQREHLQDPLVIKHKGRPRDQRLTGRPRGGGGRKSQRGGRSCGVCREPGHNCASCPLLRRC